MTRLLLGIAAIATVLPLSTAAAQVQFDRTGYRLTSIGQQIRASARVIGSNGRPTAIRWRVADPEIAGVSTQGVVEARKVGHTRLWAVAGEDSASALILVDQWAARFDFFPAAVRLHAVGDRAPLRVQVRDAGGHVINGPARRASSACRSLNERIAVFADNGITARANGVTYIRCTDRAISDSVRVDVRQRAVSVAILDKLGFSNRVAGDTFRIRVSAKDAAGGDIRNVQATWASMSPHVLSIDPLSGLARGVMQGTARVVAQVDDATDTVSVQVLPGSGVPVVASTDSTTGAVVLAQVAPPSLHLQPLFLIVDDTARVSPRDGTGAVIINADYRVTSMDTSVVRPISGQRVVARAPGNAYVAVYFGGITDSMLVSVRERSEGVVLAGETVTAAPFVRPRFNLDSARLANQQRLDSATREIRRQSVVEIYTGRMLNVSAVVGHAAHATRDTNFLDRRTGLIYGAVAEMAPFSRLRLTAAFSTGQLSPTAAAGEDLSVTEVEADVMVRPVPWFGLAGGYVRRVTRTELATQRWDFPRATASTRFNFVGGAISTTTALSLLVGARYTGYLDAQQEPINPDPFSLSGEAGIELHSRRFAAGLSYYAERFSFPRVNNNTTSRRDQFSALKLKLGYQIGR